MLSAGSGPRAVQAITAALGPIPTLFVTALPEECENLPNCVVLEKPFAAEQLAAAFVAIAQSEVQR
jgi:hypothetical protein